MKRFQPYLLLLSGLLCYFHSSANRGKSDPCLVQGYVTDAITKKPVSGVVVSATSKTAAGTIEVITDADGFYRFSQLPGSQVNLQFGKKGYQPHKRTGIWITEKGNLKINVEFLREEENFDMEDSEYPIMKLLEIH